ncbi:MAG: type I 3-dehydroquinate dehydratase [Euryarchaeota archaeon]|jgi:3-dehydroquinate dehydratase type I|nr:type I 3-dehydroquinate dehydratase [Euryarchaeota archaeon]MBT4982168.1 type I 3-dehydroquinate dehydratase [Euryarchaeota archaeon]MBT5184815.1 type I 3-dehydroquinate dehydratase [Euryarchaeota archaeon]
MADPKVCVVLDGTTVEEMTDEAARANLAGADMVEVRFDRLFLIRPDPTISEEEEGESVAMPPENEWETSEMSSVDVGAAIASLKEALPLPVVFTVRPVSEGGFFPGIESERIDILSKAIDSEVSWIDLELSIKGTERKKLQSAATKKGCQIIASKHDINGVPDAEAIVALVRENQDSGNIVKFCGTANNHSDALQIIEAATELTGEGLSHSLMALNSGGDWPRLHAPMLDQSLVYATMRNEFRISDKGLVNVRDLRDAWTLLEY